MLSKEENELLTRVTGDAPMGQMIRRYWIPACLAEEVSEPDGAPVRVKLLGEDLVAFRDTDGRIGLIDEHCPHRLASLAFGRNEQCGLRCLYHGWKFDVDGNCVDMWSEPGDKTFQNKVKIKSYPTHEAGGLIWTYMGPPEEQPVFPEFDFLKIPEQFRGIAKIVEETNFLQGVEGAIDSSHSSSLHTGTLADPRPSIDKAPRMEAEDTSYGFRYAAIRTPIEDPEKNQYVRITNFALPFFCFIPRPLDEDYPAFIHMFVPRDDVSSTFYWYEFSQNGKPLAQDVKEKYFAVLGKDLDSNYRKLRNLSNNYLQDREAMKNGSFTGIDGVPNQDMAMQESMGPIVDRTRERLGKSDIAIIRMRRRMMESVRRFIVGETPIGLDAGIPYGSIRSEQKVIPLDVPWQTVGAYANEYSAKDSKQVTK